MPITSEGFGQTKDGRNITRYTLDNSKGAHVKVLDYGGIITDIVVPDKDGQMGDVVLGFDSIKDYEEKNYYFGAVCGRTANRIAGGQFTLDGQTFKLAVNNGPNGLHGGFVGFDKKVWKAEVKNNKLVLSYTSPDGEENYPGDLSTTVTYSFDEDSILKLEYEATTSKPTILSLTNHSYFNLGGHECGNINDCVITLSAESYLPLDDTNIPLGEVKQVAGSVYDLRSPVRFGDSLDKVNNGTGYDNYYVVGDVGTPKLAARVEHPPSGRYMECRTTSPGLQLYTAYYVEPSTPGKAGAAYGRFGGFCLECSHYPDSINHPNFPSTVLRPGETYSQVTCYHFGVM